MNLAFVSSLLLRYEKEQFVIFLFSVFAFILIFLKRPIEIIQIESM